MRWTPLKPVKATSNLPLLTIEADGSVFASGDQSKRDIYTVQLRRDLPGITAIRLEVLPDDRLPNHGPGRVYYEGPSGDFFLSEIRVTADGKPVALKEATASSPKARHGGRGAIDGDPQTGWSINGGQGRAQSAVFRLAAPLESADELIVSRCSSSGTTPPGWAGSGSRRRPTRGRSRRGRLRARSSRSC